VEEIKQIEQYLGEVEAHRGRVRSVAGTSQRARASVTIAINRAIEHISASEHPELCRHLKASIRTGIAPSYSPIQAPDWDF
jgi:hypothetical protein